MFHPLKAKFMYIIKKLIPALKKTQHGSITRIILLMLCRKIITLSSENHRKAINSLSYQNAESLNVKARGTYSYCCTLRG
jgi:hypothetical protein